MGLNHSPNIVRSGLVLYLDAANVKSYPGSGTTWTDLSGNGNNGTLTNGPTYSNVNGGIFSFDGTNDYVDTKSIQFDRTNPFTLVANVYINAVNSQIINNENTSYRGYQLSFGTDNKISFLLRNTVSTNFIQVKSQNSFTLSTWKSFCITYNGSSSASGVDLYENGRSIPKDVIADSLTATTISGQTTWIGQRLPATQGPLGGNISLVQIYNRALSPAEVSQNFNALRGRYGL